MESEFERAAKRAAVDAVERRIDHDERVRRWAAFRRGVNSIVSVLFGLAVLAALAWWFKFKYLAEPEEPVPPPSPVVRVEPKKPPVKKPAPKVKKAELKRPAKEYKKAKYNK